jgi:hypothetical protein
MVIEGALSSTDDEDARPSREKIRAAHAIRASALGRARWVRQVAAMTTGLFPSSRSTRAQAPAET